MANFSSKVKALKGESLELRKVLAGLADDSGNPGDFGNVWYVDPNTGSDDGLGRSWDDAFDTMAEAFTHLESGDTIYFRGKVKEQLTAPVQVFDVTIIGSSNRPRHADAAPVGSESGATWTAPDSATADTPLLKVLQQGWTLANFLMDAPSDAPCVELLRNAASGNSERDASHFSAYGMLFIGGETGIEDNGGCYHVLLDDCEFRDLTNAVKNVSTSVAAPLAWQVRGCKFNTNTNGIDSPASKWVVEHCHFSPNHTVKIDFTGGGNNMVGPGNFLGGTYNHANYQDAANDEWAGNFNAAGVTTANPAA